MERQMKIAQARGQLISKDLAIRQATFLMIALRQRLLLAPQAWSRRLVNISDPHQMAQLLGQMMRECLTEVKDLPLKVTDPDWLASLEESEDA